MEKTCIEAGSKENRIFNRKEIIAALCCNQAIPQWLNEHIRCIFIRNVKLLGEGQSTNEY